MSGTDKEPNAETADFLVEEGLKLYSAGQLDQALTKWREALDSIPDHPRAKDYIKYVEDNRTALEESFRIAAVDEGEEGSRGEPEAPAFAAVAEGEEEGSGGEPEALAAAAAPQAELKPDGAEPPGEEQVSPPAGNEEVETGWGDVAAELAEPAPPSRGGAAAAEEALERGEVGIQVRDQVVLVAAPHTTRRRPEERVETTARMDVEELRARLNATKLRTKASRSQEEGDEEGDGLVPPGGAPLGEEDETPEVHARLTPATLSPAVDAARERSRKATPLVVVAGEGVPQQEGFEPLEQTPLGIGMPEPARLMDDASSGFSADERTPVEDLSEGLPEGAEVPGGLHPSSTQTALGAPDEGERVESMLAGARQLLEQGTNEGSLWLCERILTLDSDNAEAQELLQRNRAVLQGQYEQQIGDLECVPVVQIPQHEIMWHKLDHRAGFLLSRIDGQLTYGDIVDVSGMGSFEATRILAQLQGMGVIGHRK